MFRTIFFLIVSFNAFAFDWQGHRGARGLYPENTIGAMEVALQYPITTLEMDVVVSKDKKIIVSHEPWMGEEICLNPDGRRVKIREYNIYKMTYEEIVKFDCGSATHPRFPQQKKITVGKPTLEKLISVTEMKLKSLNRSAVEYNIEIKSTLQDEKEGFQPDYKTFSDLVMAKLKSLLPSNKYTIQSFDWRVLKYIHEKYPEVRLVALKEENFSPSEVIKELGFKPYIFSPWFKHLSAEKVKDLQNLGMKVIPWTVNDVADLKAIKRMGVNGIITDYPDRITEALDPKCKKGFHLFENKCIKLPKHSLPSSTIPGWNCKSGYIQKRSRCIKVAVPKNAHLLPDGKNWACDEGFKKYRSTCVK
jgi:glycerophosphoryl diester phosphodiesterase